MALSDAVKKRIERWISESGRNQFGDPQGTVYAGGNPLFDERRARPLDRHEYILGRHPEIKELLRREGIE